MKDHHRSPKDADDLRQQAKKRLKERRDRNKEDQPSMPDMPRLIQELQIHQVELEIQQEELIQSRAAMESGLALYTDLYDFAPVGYFTLDGKGVILRANLTGAKLLGLERSRLIGQRLKLFLSVSDQTVFTAFLAKVLTSGQKQVCDVALRPDQKLPSSPAESNNRRIMHIQATASGDGQECNVVLTDITKSRQMEQLLLFKQLLIDLNSCSDLRQGLDRVLHAVLELECIDSGGVYIADPADHSLTLVAHLGLSNEFVERVSHFDADSERVRMVFTGETYYGTYADIITSQDDIRLREGLRAFGIIPIMSRGQLIAVLNLTSHHVESIPAETRNSLETIALQIGSALLRLRTEIELRKGEQQYRFMMENIKDVVWVMDTETMQFLYVSPSVVGLRGYTPEELLAAPATSNLTPEDSDYIINITRSRVSDFLSGKEAPDKFYINEIRQTCKDGSTVWAEVITSYYINQENGRVELRGVSRDITERKRVEETLRASEERFRRMFQHSPLGMVLISPDFHFLQGNDTFCKMLGYTEAELRQKTSQDLTPEEDRQLGRDNTRLVLSGEMETFEFDKRYLHKDGSVVWGQVSSTLIRDMQNQPQYFIIQVQDITERKRVEETLRASEERFRRMFQYSAAGMVLVSPDFHFLQANIAFCKMLGYNEAELLQKTFQDVTLREDRWVGREVVRAVLSSEKETFNLEKRYLHKNGAVVWGLISATMIRDAQNNPLYIVAQIQDISDRKLSEIKLAERNQFIESLVNMTPDILYIYDLVDQKNIYINNGIQKILGYSVEEVQDMGNSVISMLMHPDDLQEYIKTILPQYKAAKGNEPIIHQYRMRHKTGDWRWLDTNEIIYKRDPDGSPRQLFGMIHDITENKRTEEIIRESELQYRNMTNAGLALIWTAGTDKLCNYFNEPWLRFTGRTLAQEVGNGWTEGVHPDDLDRCVQIYVTAFDKREAFDMEYRLRHAGGDYRWIKDLGKPNYNVNGEFIGYIGHCFDVTAQRNAEAQREAALEEIRNLNINLEQRINERTAELRETIAQLEEMNRVFVGRELRMIELKEQIAKLEKQKT